MENSEHPVDECGRKESANLPPLSRFTGTMAEVREAGIGSAVGVLHGRKPRGGIRRTPTVLFQPQPCCYIL
jgi:hypothetical protein